MAQRKKKFKVTKRKTVVKKKPKSLKERLIEMKLSSLNFHPKNPRDHDEGNLKDIMESYENFGEMQPVVVWGMKNYVIVGNGRLEAATRLGLKVLSIVRADHLTKDEAESYMIADNKSSDSSKFNKELLADMFQGLHGRGADLSQTGFSRFEIEPLITPDDGNHDFSQFEDEIEKLSGEDRVIIGVEVQVKFVERVTEWLANGEKKTASGLGKGVMKRCGLRSSKSKVKVNSSRSSS